MLSPRLGIVADIAFGLVVTALPTIHLALGASPLAVLIALAGWVVCYLPARLVGLDDPGALLILLIGLRYTFVAAVILVGFGLPLDHDALASPIASFTWVLAGSVATIAAWAVVRTALFRRPLGALAQALGS